MENLRQYEFCHHLLESVLVGGVKPSEAKPTPRASKTDKKPSKWRLFHGKTSTEKSNKPMATASSAVAASDSGLGGGGGAKDRGGKQVKQAKQPKEKKNKKTSKVGQVPGYIPVTWYMW